MTNWEECDDYWPNGFDAVADALTDTDGPPNVLSLWNWVFEDDVEDGSPMDTVLYGIWFGGEQSHKRLVVEAFGQAGGRDNSLDDAVEFMIDNPDDPDVVSARAAMARLLVRCASAALSPDP